MKYFMVNSRNGRPRPSKVKWLLDEEMRILSRRLGRTAQQLVKERIRILPVVPNMLRLRPRRLQRAAPGQNPKSKNEQTPSHILAIKK